MNYFWEILERVMGDKMEEQANFPFKKKEN